MQNPRCPKCGQGAAADSPCPDCGDASANGSVKKSRVKPPPPPEVADWVIEPVPPELAEEFLRTFDEAEYLAAVRELERTGGLRLEDFIDEIERIANGSE